MMNKNWLPEGGWEEFTKKQFVECSIVDAIGRSAKLFKMQHGVDVSIIFIDKKLCAALSVELIRDLGIPPESAVMFPAVLDNIPIMPSRLLQPGEFVHLVNHQRQITEVM